MKNIIFIAPPAAGKGSQSNLLMERCGYTHISTGDLLRKEISKQTSIGMEVKNIIESGGLVSDDVVITLINNKFKEISGKPFILDGFPRTLNQAKALSEILDKNYSVIYLYLTKEEALKRATSRITCECGASYNLLNENLRPKEEGICDKCGKSLITRSDDNESSFNKRYSVYFENLDDLLKFYSNKIKQIDATLDKETIYKEIEKEIND